MSVSLDLQDLLRVCVRGALAAQQYIALDLLKLSRLKLSEHGKTATSILELGDEEKKELLRSLTESVSVDVKAELDYKEGDASHDLVTTADILTQAVLVRALHAAFPETPFTIVGEEEEVGATGQDTALAEKVDYCYSRYYSVEGVLPAVPCADALAQHVSSQSEPSARGIVTADSLSALRRRVGIYIDPIDGTNCFVSGVWQSPMTLVGITVDGVPLAGVANRVFIFPIGASADRSRSGDSVSYVWNVSPAIAGSAFMVHEGQHVPLAHQRAEKPIGQESPLQVVQSSTTKASSLASISEGLKPSETLLARGAGNKLFSLVEKTLSQEYGVAQRRCGAALHADVFVCPGHTIKKWDTCAPQAFLVALGGDVYTHHGVPLRYPLTGSDDVHASTFTDLPDGIVAVRGAATACVAQRLHWRAPA